MGKSAKEGPIWAAGMMSGTSLDGVDVAVLETDGLDIMGFGPSSYLGYTPGAQEVLRCALGAWPGDVPEAAIALVHDVHEQAFSQLAPLEDGEIALAGFHGQTLAHDPKGRGTHQAGDGQVLANRIGVPVVWDFRTADVALGGQGAPLAPFYHFACARLIGAAGPVAFLNLGGVGNVTWVDPTRHGPEDPEALLAFDTGPANAPLNDLMAARRGLSHDKDGALARQGRVVEGALELFLQEVYFRRVPPKSLDRNDFSLMLDLVRELSDADAAATMCAMAASAVMQGVEHFPKPVGRVLVCGGGRHNPVIMEMLAAALDCPVAAVESVGLDGDMLEAQAFAYLAVRVARGLATSCPTTTGVPALVGGGTVSTPI